MKTEKADQDSGIRGVLGGAVVLAIAYVILQTQMAPSGPKPAAVTARTHGTHADWPGILYEPPAYGGVPQSLPIMRRTNVDVVAASNPSSPDHHLLLERLQQLVTQNVAPEIYTELDRLLRAHDIIYVLDPYTLAAAEFGIEGGIPKMHFNANVIANIDNAGDELWFMIVIAHEFVHYKQWQRATDPFERASFSVGVPQVLGPKICELLWRNERDAYAHQCLYLNRYGLVWTVPEDRQDFCKRVGSPRAFDQAHYYWRIANAQPDEKEVCGELWWDLAGGPRN